MKFSPGHLIAVAVPLVGIGVGAYFLTRGEAPSEAEKGSTSVQSQTQGRGDTSSDSRKKKIEETASTPTLASNDLKNSNKKGKRSPASAFEPGDREPLSWSKREDAERESKKALAQSASQSAPVAAAAPSVAPSVTTEATGQVAQQIGSSVEGPRNPSSTSDGAKGDAASTIPQVQECVATEFAGAGPEKTKITKAEWAQVMGVFHASKAKLTAWVLSRKELPRNQATLLESRVKSLKIQRPPSGDEPDLSWRGVGVYTQPSAGESFVKVGGGFVRLAQVDPRRAQFELTRLIAQAWAPCELKRVGGAELAALWDPLLECLSLPLMTARSPSSTTGSADACGEGTFSEAGWGVSTTLAAALSPPGCPVQAWKEPALAKCIQTIPMAFAEEKTRTPAQAEAPAPKTQAPPAGNAH